MIISKCPRCHEGLRIPTGAIPEDAFAHCPWCQETFPISEVLGRLPPVLQIVSADGEPLVINEQAVGNAQHASAAAQAAGGDSNRWGLIEAGSPPHAAASSDAAAEEEPSFQAFSLDQDRDEDQHTTIAEETVAETIADENWDQPESFPGWGQPQLASGSEEDPYSTFDAQSQSADGSVQVSTRGNGRSKRKSSGIGTLIGIVLGGLASVPIAGALLMMLGRTPDWGFWPFNGEQASPSVRAAAPLPSSEPAKPPRSDAGAATGTSLRFNREDSDIDATVDPAESAAEEILSASLGDQSDQEPPPAATSLAASGSDSDSVSTSEDVAVEEASTPAPGESIAASEESTRESTTSQASSSTQGSPVEPQPEPAASKPESEAEKYADRSSQMLDVIMKDPVDEAERRRRLAMTYKTIAFAAELADPSGETLQALAAKIAASPLKEEIRSAGWEWLGSEQRQWDGIALIGRIKNAEDGTVLTGDSGESIPLVVEEALAEDGEVLVMGRLEDEGKSLRVVHAEPIP